VFVKSLPFVRYIEEDSELFMLDYGPPETLLTVHQAGPIVSESIDWGVRRINAPETWDITQGRNVGIGVIDTGISSSHPDLSGAVIGGFNAINEGSYEDDNNHGTYVASVIAARRNGVGIVGVAPEAMLYSIKTMNSKGRGYISDVIKGCQWGLNNGIRILNMSLGSGVNSNALREAMDVLASHGIATIAACGNEGKHGEYYPARDNVTVCVGGSDMDDKRAAISDYGAALKDNGVLAPGEWIHVANKDGEWQNVSGTSIATPHVTGIVALLSEIGIHDREHIRKYIFSGASQPENPDEFNGHGVVNAKRALDLLIH